MAVINRALNTGGNDSFRLDDMVAIFIDESGTFTPSSLFNVVAALALPHKSLGRARREVLRVSQDWPRLDGELKGGQITAPQLSLLVDALFRNHALLFCVGTRIAAEDSPTISAEQQKQCEGITARLLDHHPPAVKEELWAYRHKLEGMPLQLFAQFAAQTELLSNAIEDIPNYLCQRRPSELAKFDWFVDAKDKVLTPQEGWWREIVAPLMSGQSRELPHGRLHFPGFDYSHFYRSYQRELPAGDWRDPEKPEFGIDIGKVVTERMSFIDSKSDVLIQSIDILCSFLRRALNGTVIDPTVVNALGRLLIKKKDRGSLQGLRLLAFARSLPPSPELNAVVQTMTSAGRSMILANRWEMMTNAEARTGPSTDIPPKRRPIPWRHN